MLIRSAKELALLVINQRKKLNLSQSEVGQRVGLKQQTISDFERHPEGTKLTTLFSILSAVELDLHLLRKDDPSPSEALWKEEW